MFNANNGSKQGIYNEDLIKKAETTAEKVISAKECKNVDFDFIEKMLFEYCMQNDYSDVDDEKIFFKKWEIIAYTLKYYKSIDRTLYEHIRDVIYNQKLNIRMNIYNIDEITDFEEPDFEFSKMKRYRLSPCNFTNYNKNIITMPLRHKKKIIHENYEASLNDLYTLIHETAHTFDIDLGIIIDEQSIIINRDYDLKMIFNESIARAFELNATQFFLRNGIIKNRRDASFTLDFLNNFTLTKNYSVYIKLRLAKIYEEKGKITAEDLDEIFNPFNKFKPDERIKTLKIITEDNSSEQYEKNYFIDMGYAIVGIISPTIVELLKNKKIEEIKLFFELSRLGYFEKALNALNISVDEKGLETLIKNMQKNGFKLGDNREDETDIEK